MARLVYFVLSVDLDDKSVMIDDETFIARFGKNEQVWDEELNEWRDYADGEYEQAVDILTQQKIGDE
jgi:hypothetical protein